MPLHGINFFDNLWQLRKDDQSNHRHFLLHIPRVMQGKAIKHFQAYTWWRHEMETFSASLALCEGNTHITGGFAPQRPGTWSFFVFFCANNRDAGDLSRHRAHYDVTVIRTIQKRHADFLHLNYMLVIRSIEYDRIIHTHAFICTYK